MTDSGQDGPWKPVLRPGSVTETSIELWWDDDPAATEWRVRRTPGGADPATVGQPRWLETGLMPGTVYEFAVDAVDGDHGLASSEATIVVATSG